MIEQLQYKLGGIIIPTVAVIRVLRVPMLNGKRAAESCDSLRCLNVTGLPKGIRILFRGQPMVLLGATDRCSITARFIQRFSLFQDAADKARLPGTVVC